MNILQLGAARRNGDRKTLLMNAKHLCFQLGDIQRYDELIMLHGEEFLTEYFNILSDCDLKNYHEAR